MRAAKARYDQVSRAKRSTALAEHEQTHHLSQAEVPVRLAEAAVERVASSRGLFPLGESVEGFVERMLEVSVRQMYGWTVYACLFLFLLFLLYDAPIRRDLKRMPGWRALREEVARSFWRTGHKGGA